MAQKTLEDKVVVDVKAMRKLMHIAQMTQYGTPDYPQFYEISTYGLNRLGQQKDGMPIIDDFIVEENQKVAEASVSLAQDYPDQLKRLNNEEQIIPPLRAHSHGLMDVFYSHFDKDRFQSDFNWYGLETLERDSADVIKKACNEIYGLTVNVHGDLFGIKGVRLIDNDVDVWPVDNVPASAEIFKNSDGILIYYAEVPVEVVAIDNALAYSFEDLATAVEHCVSVKNGTDAPDPFKVSHDALPTIPKKVKDKFSGNEYSLLEAAVDDEVEEEQTAADFQTTFTYQVPFSDAQSTFVHTPYVETIDDVVPKNEPAIEEVAPLTDVFPTVMHYDMVIGQLIGLYLADEIKNHPSQALEIIEYFNDYLPSLRMDEGVDVTVLANKAYETIKQQVFDRYDAAWKDYLITTPFVTAKDKMMGYLHLRSKDDEQESISKQIEDFKEMRGVFSMLGYDDRVSAIDRRIDRLSIQLEEHAK